MKWITAVLINYLLLNQWNLSGTQIIPSPSEPVCPGNRINFTCQQLGGTQWTVHLQPALLQSAAQSTQVGSIITFGVDRGFNFELHIVSFSSGILTTELQVTAVRELNGVTVGCDGPDGNFLSIIQVTSIAAPSGVMATNKQFTKTGASVNVTWSTSRGADNYTVNVTPPIMSGQLSDFTTTDTSLLLMLDYNINYTINITAQNCAGSNSTVLPITIAGCSPPSPLTNGRINEYHNGSVGASLTLQCNTGYLPHQLVISTCMTNGNWVPIPQCMLANCGSPSVSSDGGVVIEPFDDAMTSFNDTITFHCEEGLIPNTTIEAVCGSTGVWSPNPANHMCVNQSSAFCTAPAVPTDAHISDQSTGFYPEGANITLQCDDVSHTELTTVCHADGSWRPRPSELDCTVTTATSESATVTVTTDVKKVLSSSSQTILSTVVCSFVFFFLGVLVGVLCHRWGRVFIKPCTGDIKRSNGKRREHPSPTDTPADDAPVVYEEVTTDSHSRQKIELEENVASVHI